MMCAVIKQKPDVCSEDEAQIHTKDSNVQRDFNSVSQTEGGLYLLMIIWREWWSIFYICICY